MNAGAARRSRYGSPLSRADNENVGFFIIAALRALGAERFHNHFCLHTATEERPILRLADFWDVDRPT